jgi:hypothetical protein
MKEISILLVAVFGYSAVIPAAILAHRRLLPHPPLQGVDRKSTSRLVRHSFSEGGKKVSLERWQTSILQLAVKQARLQPIEAMPG